ncbi:hypothetical protein ACIRBX_17415 [Kitasatospora sp. NPDC096147]|uniref:hypothetical protein n=1 Tax=Kitasatospora sp. NPDC096147 TaxID=3364093 RepID=UPI00381318CB
MSRTVRTIPYRLRTAEPGPVSLARLDLRYPHAELTRAAREGRRPVPVPTLRRLRSRHWNRLDGSTDGFTAMIATSNGRARLRARLAADRIRGLHRAGHSVDGADVPPARHRRDALWHA